MVSETRPMVLAKGHTHGGARQAALLEVLDALKAAEVDDRVRQAAQTIYQALIGAELTSVIGAAPAPAHARAAGPTQRPPAHGAEHHGLGIWSCGSPSCVGRLHPQGRRLGPHVGR
jgi:hypothetical protein